MLNKKGALPLGMHVNLVRPKYVWNKIARLMIVAEVKWKKVEILKRNRFDENHLN